MPLHNEDIATIGYLGGSDISQGLVLQRTHHGNVAVGNHPDRHAIGG